MYASIILKLDVLQLYGNNAEILSAIASCGFVEAWFDREDESADLKGSEAASIEWGTCKAVSEHPEPEMVDVVCDSGEKGKEPIIRLLG